MVSTANFLMTAYFAMGYPLKVVNISSKVIKVIEGAKKEYDYFGIWWLPYSNFCGIRILNLALIGKFREAQIDIELVKTEKALEYLAKAESMGKEMDYWLKRTQKALDRL